MYMSFSAKHKIIHFDYKVDVSIVPLSSTCFDYGILFDSKLSLIPHINEQANRCSRVLAIIINNSCDLTQIIHSEFFCTVLMYGPNLNNRV